MEGRKEGRNFLKRKPKAYKALIHDTRQRVNDGNKVSLFTGIALTKDLSKRNTVKGRPGTHVAVNVSSGRYVHACEFL